MCEELFWDLRALFFKSCANAAVTHASYTLPCAIHECAVGATYFKEMVEPIIDSCCARLLENQSKHVYSVIILHLADHGIV